MKELLEADAVGDVEKYERIVHELETMSWTAEEARAKVPWTFHSCISTAIR
jgi:hypothetical protein